MSQDLYLVPIIQINTIISINHFTKWIEALVINNVNFTKTALLLHNYIITRHGCPYSVLSNNGLNFISYILKLLLKLMVISQQFTVPCTLSTNGTIKRVNDTLMSILKYYQLIILCNRMNFLTLLLRIEYQHRAIQTLPFKALYRQDAPLSS